MIHTNTKKIEEDQKEIGNKPKEINTRTVTAHMVILIHLALGFLLLLLWLVFDLHDWGNLEIFWKF